MLTRHAKGAHARGVPLLILPNSHVKCHKRYKIGSCHSRKGACNSQVDERVVLTRIVRVQLLVPYAPRVLPRLTGSTTVVGGIPTSGSCSEALSFQFRARGGNTYFRRCSRTCIQKAHLFSRCVPFPSSTYVTQRPPHKDFRYCLFEARTPLSCLDLEVLASPR